MSQAKNFEYVNADNLERLLHGNLSTQAIAEELGRNRGTITKWVSDG